LRAWPVRAATEDTSMRITTITIAALAVLALAGTASAQDRAAPVQPSADTVYTFNDHDVEGGIRGPDGDVLRFRARGHRQTLVRPRMHFVPELMHSVERL
jgi:hypothetical protein